jgi:glutamate-1-semialdehyde 2,1-aminomutase
MLGLSDSPIVKQYCEKTPTSGALAEQARGVFPSGITHDVRYIEPHGIFVAKAQGSRKWDVDGNEYVDHPGGHGALLLGHGHPAVIEAVAKQLPLGTHYGACHELELRWGKLIQQLVPCAERVRLTNSGTETTLLALRLARAFTQRKKIVRFTGHFHGWHDHATFGVTSHFDGTTTAGVLSEVAENVLLAPPWDLEETRRIIEANDDIAAVIIEPTGSVWGQVPIAKGFLESLREMTAERGIVLIFDEVISGFRCAPGGAQAALGITPDLACLGKIVAGGMPGAALVGRKAILDLLDFRHTRAAGVEKVGHQGTFNGMPTSCAAGIATLELVRQTDVCQKAIDYGQGLQHALNEMFRQESTDWIAYGSFGGFHVFLNPNGMDTTRDEIESGKFDYFTLRAPVKPTLMMKLRLGLLLHGVDVQPWPGAPVSAVHNSDDMQQTVAAFRQTIRMLRSEEEI